MRVGSRLSSVDLCDAIGVEVSSRAAQDLERQFSEAVRVYQIQRLWREEAPSFQDMDEQIRGLLNGISDLQELLQALSNHVWMQIEADLSDEGFEVLGNLPSASVETTLKHLASAAERARDNLSALRSQVSSATTTQWEVVPRSGTRGQQKKAARDQFVRSLLKIFTQIRGEHKHSARTPFRKKTEAEIQEVRFIRLGLDHIGEDRLEQAGAESLIRRLRRDEK